MVAWVLHMVLIRSAALVGFTVWPANAGWYCGNAIREGPGRPARVHAARPRFDPWAILRSSTAIADTAAGPGRVRPPRARRGLCHWTLGNPRFGRLLESIDGRVQVACHFHNVDLCPAQRLRALPPSHLNLQAVPVGCGALVAPVHLLGVAGNAMRGVEQFTTRLSERGSGCDEPASENAQKGRHWRTHGCAAREHRLGCLASRRFGNLPAFQCRHGSLLVLELGLGALFALAPLMHSNRG